MSGFRRIVTQPGPGLAAGGGRLRPRVSGGRPAGGQQQLTVVSSGVPALDALIGGGLALSSVCVIDEDATGAYAGVLTRYFLAQSLLDEHHVLLVSCDHAHTDYLLANLPDLEDAKIGDSRQSAAAPLSGPGVDRDIDEGLAVAWRYRNAPQFEELHSLEKASTGARNFDLSKKLDLKRLDEAGSLRLQRLDLTEFSTFAENASQVLAKIREQLVGRPDYQYPSQPGDSKQSVLKVVIPSFASALWGCVVDEFEVLRFLYTLQIMCSEHLCTAWLTVPDWLRLQRLVLSDRMRHLSDYWLRLESLGDSRRSANPLYKDLHGLISLDKLPCLGSVAPVARPDTLELGFKVRRKNFLIQRLHLPPDISETASRVSKAPQSACGSSSIGSSIDF